MAESSAIAWTRSTFNPWIGCTKVGPGCDGCYAEALDARHQWGGGKHWGVAVPRFRTSPRTWAAPVKWNRDALSEQIRWLVFCSSLADVFDNEVPDEWRAELWALIEATPALTWQLVTKRVGNVVKMIPPAWRDGMPRNVWVISTIVNQEEADRDLPKLIEVPATVHGVSYEPALGPVDWSPWLLPKAHVNWGDNTNPTADERRALAMIARVAHRQMGGRLLDWIIVGGESSQPNHPARRFDLSWARVTVAQCRGAGVPVFVKQLGARPVWQGMHVTLRDRAGADMAEWPLDLQVREFPT